MTETALGFQGRAERHLSDVIKRQDRELADLNFKIKSMAGMVKDKASRVSEARQGIREVISMMENQIKRLEDDSSSRSASIAYGMLDKAKRISGLR